MKPVEQYNEWACTVGCLASFLIDIKKTEVDQKKDIVELDYGKDLNPFCVGTPQEGLMNWGWSQELEDLAKNKGMNPQDFKKDEKILKEFLSSLDGDEVSLLADVVRVAFEPIAKVHDLEIVGVNYLSEVLRGGELPPEETYLIAAFVIGESRDNHVLRSQGRHANGELEVMDPKPGKVGSYETKLFESGKSFFVRFRHKEMT